MPQETGAVSPSMALAAMAASTAEPPRSSTAIAARVEASFSVATAKRPRPPAAPALGMAVRVKDAHTAAAAAGRDHRGKPQGVIAVIAVIVVTGRRAIGDRRAVCYF